MDSQCKLHAVSCRLSRRNLRRPSYRGLGAGQMRWPCCPHAARAAFLTFRGLCRPVGMVCEKRTGSAPPCSAHRDVRTHSPARARVSSTHLSLSEVGRLRREGLHAFPSNITRDYPPITRDYPPSLLTLQGMTLRLKGTALPPFLLLQGITLQLQGMTLPPF